MLLQGVVVVLQLPLVNVDAEGVHLLDHRRDEGYLSLGPDQLPNAVNHEDYLLGRTVGGEAGLLGLSGVGVGAVAPLELEGGGEGVLQADRLELQGVDFAGEEKGGRGRGGGRGGRIRREGLSFGGGPEDLREVKSESCTCSMHVVVQVRFISLGLTSSSTALYFFPPL